MAAGTGQGGAAKWDVFLSYSRSDAQRAGAVSAALRRQGLRVFVDDASVEDAASISHTITVGLARSTTLLALYSHDYPKRRACQWELTYAFLCGQREGDPRRRVLVLNPEAGTDHVQPVELRDARHFGWSSDGEALDAVATGVAAHCTELGSAMGAAGHAPATAPQAPWLPAPARTGSPHFTGRFAEQWRLHSALRRHHTPLVHRSGQGAGRAAVLCGMPGIGKSLLAQDYALSFHSAYPGGVFWFDLHAVVDAAPEAVVRAYAEQVAVVVDTLAPPEPNTEGQSQRGQGQSHGRPAPERLAPDLSRLAVLFGSRNAPFLWVVDGLPDGLTDAMLHQLRAPHLLGSTLVTTRSQHYARFWEMIDVPPLPEAEAYWLLTARRPPETADEAASAQALVRDLGGHPQALDLLAAQAAANGFTHTRGRFHAPGVDILTAPGSGTARAPLTAKLLRRPLTASGPADDVLRLLALACPTSLSRATLEAALTAHLGYAAGDTGSLLDLALDSLLGAGVLRRATGPWERSWGVHPLLARAVRRHDDDLARQEDLRRALLRTLSRPSAGAETPSPETEYTEAAIDHVTPAPSPVERAAAFDLQVELVTRVGVQPLSEGDGSLREALTSLHSLFTAARDAMHRVASEATVPQHLPAIAAPLLNTHLRPFLTYWHSALQQHEARRPRGTSVVGHEQRWAHSDGFRADLRKLRIPLTRAAEDLASLCGVTLLDPAPRER